MPPAIIPSDEVGDRDPATALHPDAIAVAIPTHQRWGDLERCLRSIEGQLLDGDLLIVGVDEEDEQSREIAAAHRATTVEVSERGVVRKLNAMAESINVPVVAFLDDDAEAGPSWLSDIRTAMSDQTVGCFGGRDYVPHLKHLKPVTTVGRIGITGRPIGMHHRGLGPVRDVDFLKGVNLACRRDLLPISGELAYEGAEPHWELDICFRARRRGWRIVYDPSHEVRHNASKRPDGSRADHGRLAYVTARNETATLCAWQPWPMTVRVLLYQLVLGRAPTYGALRALVGALRHEPDVHRTFRSGLRGRRDGLRLARSMRRRARDGR